jgi:hypothetical protein
MNQNPIIGVIGIGIVLSGVFVSFMVFRTRIKSRFLRSLAVWATGVPLGIGFLYLAQFILNQIGMGIRH